MAHYSSVFLFLLSGFFVLDSYCQVSLRSQSNLFDESQSGRQIYPHSSDSFLMNVDEGYFTCLTNDTIKGLSIFKISRLCDGVQDCTEGLDEKYESLGCLDCDCSSQGVCLKSSSLNSRCFCNEGFGGPFCERSDEWNECRKRPCSSEGHCINRFQGFLCECNEGFEGKLCERRRSTFENETSGRILSHVQNILQGLFKDHKYETTNGSELFHLRNGTSLQTLNSYLGHPIEFQDSVRGDSKGKISETDDYSMENTTPLSEDYTLKFLEFTTVRNDYGIYNDVNSLEILNLFNNSISNLTSSSVLETQTSNFSENNVNAYEIYNETKISSFPFNVLTTVVPLFNEEINDSAYIPSDTIQNGILHFSEETNNSVFIPFDTINKVVPLFSEETNESVSLPLDIIQNGVPYSTEETNNSAFIPFDTVNKVFSEETNDSVYLPFDTIQNDVPLISTETNDSTPQYYDTIQNFVSLFSEETNESASLPFDNIQNGVPYFSKEINDSTPQSYDTTQNGLSYFIEEINDSTPQYDDAIQNGVPLLGEETNKSVSLPLNVNTTVGFSSSKELNNSATNLFDTIQTITSSFRDNNKDATSLPFVVNQTFDSSSFTETPEYILPSTVLQTDRFRENNKDATSLPFVVNQTFASSSSFTQTPEYSNDMLLNELQTHGSPSREENNENINSKKHLLTNSSRASQNLTLDSSSISEEQNESYVKSAKNENFSSLSKPLNSSEPIEIFTTGPYLMDSYANVRDEEPDLKTSNLTLETISEKSSSFTLNQSLLNELSNIFIRNESSSVDSNLRLSNKDENKVQSSSFPFSSNPSGNSLLPSSESTTNVLSSNNSLNSSATFSSVTTQLYDYSLFPLFNESFPRDLTPSLTTEESRVNYSSSFSSSPQFFRHPILQRLHFNYTIRNLLKANSENLLFYEAQNTCDPPFLNCSLRPESLCATNYDECVKLIVHSDSINSGIIDFSSLLQCALYQVSCLFPSKEFCESQFETCSLKAFSELKSQRRAGNCLSALRSCIKPESVCLYDYEICKKETLEKSFNDDNTFCFSEYESCIDENSNEQSSLCSSKLYLCLSRPRENVLNGRERLQSFPSLSTELRSCSQETLECLKDSQNNSQHCSSIYSFCSRRVRNSKRRIDYKSHDDDEENTADTQELCSQYQNSTCVTKDCKELYNNCRIQVFNSMTSKLIEKSILKTKDSFINCTQLSNESPKTFVECTKILLSSFYNVSFEPCSEEFYHCLPYKSESECLNIFSNCSKSLLLTISVNSSEQQLVCLNNFRNCELGVDCLFDFTDCSKGLLAFQKDNNKEQSLKPSSIQIYRYENSSSSKCDELLNGKYGSFSGRPAASTADCVWDFFICAKKYKKICCDLRFKACNDLIEKRIFPTKKPVDNLSSLSSDPITSTTQKNNNTSFTPCYWKYFGCTNQQNKSDEDCRQELHDCDSGFTLRPSLLSTSQKSSVSSSFVISSFPESHESREASVISFLYPSKSSSVINFTSQISENESLALFLKDSCVKSYFDCTASSFNDSLCQSNYKTCGNGEKIDSLLCLTLMKNNPQHYLIPHPTHCSKFFSCQKLTSKTFIAHLMTCPKNTVFDTKLMICNHESKTSNCRQKKFLFESLETEFSAKQTNEGVLKSHIPEFGYYYTQVMNGNSKLYKNWVLLSCLLLPLLTISIIII